MKKRKRSGEPRIEGWPPRPCINDAQRRLKVKKLNRELDELIWAEGMEFQSDKTAMEEAECFYIAWRIKAAIQQRDYEELFGWFSLWSEHPEPHRKMIEIVSDGKRGPKRNPALLWASEQLDHANQILREVYGGRPAKDDHPTKEEIIVDRWNNMRTAINGPPLTVDQLVEYRRKHGRSKRRG
jgi:hypothetical protein